MERPSRSRGHGFALVVLLLLSGCQVRVVLGDDPGCDGSPGCVGDAGTPDGGPEDAGTTALTLSSGWLHTCALRPGGRLHCWGGNTYGQLGDPGTPSATWREVTELPAPAVGLTAGGSRSCAWLRDGELYCWGSVFTGQLTTPKRVAVPPVRAACSGFEHTCVLTLTGEVHCWGYNSSGAVGDGTLSPREVPAQVAGLAGVRQLACGTQNTCAVLSSGAVYCWGDNSGHQLGTASWLPEPVPGRVWGLDAGVKAMALGSLHACAQLERGTVQCWGTNALGELGAEGVDASVAPLDVPGLEDVVALSAGNHHTCAVSSAGVARCWGSNEDGALGGGTATPRTALVEARGPWRRVVQVDASLRRTCLIDSDSQVYCWGSNEQSALGPNATEPVHLNPVAVPLPGG